MILCLDCFQSHKSGLLEPKVVIAIFPLTSSSLHLFLIDPGLFSFVLSRRSRLAIPKQLAHLLLDVDTELRRNSKIFAELRDLICGEAKFALSGCLCLALLGAVAEGFAFLIGALGGIFEKQLSSSCCACGMVRPSHANYLNSSSDDVVHTLRMLVICRSANDPLSVVALLLFKSWILGPQCLALFYACLTWGLSHPTRDFKRDIIVGFFLI